MPRGLNIKCNRCGDKITRPGALVFSPPREMTVGNHIVHKFHICEECWDSVGLWVQGIDHKILRGKQPKPSKNPVL